MNAVKFDWLDVVEVLHSDDREFIIKLLHGSEFVIFICESKNKIESFEVSNCGNPQNSIDKDFKVYFVDTETVCNVDDFYGLHAIEGMPFKLTGHQINTINSYLEEIAEIV